MFMCGIFGYVGKKEALPILLDGLRALEYRGYDSAGIYIPGFSPIKSVGPIDNLVKKIKSQIPGTTGIAHTRWATHGSPTEKNSHPHLDMSGSIALVHNGIIENHRELKDGLLMQGITFESETDSEVLAKLIGTLYAGDLVKAVQDALKLVQGTYGIIVSSNFEPDEIITARLGSPVVIGLAKDGNFVSSDPSALLSYTKDVIYLQDGELARVTKDKYEILSLKGEKIKRVSEKIDMDISEVQKQGYEHFMLKEIMEMPEVIKNTIRGRVIAGKGRAKLSGIEKVMGSLSEVDRLVIVGCGSAYFAGQVGQMMLEEYTGLQVDVRVASEYRYRISTESENTAVLAVTQSGETADTLASVRAAKEKGFLALGMVNNVGSAVARETDAGIYNHAGPEIAVASTKAFISQMVVFVLLTLAIGRRTKMTQEEGIKIAKSLLELPKIIEKYLKDTEDVKKVAKKYARYKNAMFMGRKYQTSIAFEGALKLKEVAYIHSDAYPAGELKHGPIAMLDGNSPVVAIALQDDVYVKMISNIEEIKARKAPVLAIATEGDKEITKIVDDVLYVPKVHPILQPIVSVIPLQLLAYYIGIEKGLNVDQPRNLAKSVTVE